MKTITMYIVLACLSFVYGWFSAGFGISKEEGFLFTFFAMLFFAMGVVMAINSTEKSNS